ncbi:hypothetical protein EJ06DRAFT_529366 [Trichodelitschia bisporula]|uniref:FAS1 domain-containing protein n=1 Tax=Trichodelitschia bisporula TaxID=703511 RepID=A0A6G1HZE4_9PEZI|nr:hypothetical protein EJ06DRAFT_529366 [Trichodelitschia bisporula]
MKYTAAIIVLASAVTAASVDGASATLALIDALPSSLKSLALVSPAAVSAEILSEFATGTPTWFTVLPTDVQSYFVSANSAAAASLLSAASAFPTGAPNATGIYSNSTASITKATLKTTKTASITDTESSGSAATTSSSKSSSGAGSVPTQAIGAGLAGLMGVVGLFAL